MTPLRGPFLLLHNLEADWTVSLQARVVCRANTNQMNYSCNDYQNMENLMGASKHETCAKVDLGTWDLGVDMLL
ncbi:hypothetical protein V497_00448 [Pseudogymnoascus sp. VKM F-4516 (FW-969)]|nr:hypothetical protein V497_00448 [Pseudogymnoascus sp. VKM F-4516 (FW-969)]